MGPISTTINFQKCGTMFYCLGLMYYFDTFEHAPSWVYLSMHGTYGLLWYLKECIFPDPSWTRQCTLFQHVVGFLAILGPYWYFAYSVNSKRTEVSFLRMAICISVHNIGCVLMMGADTQKYYVLKIRKGLISNGWFAISRNPNYLGEIMIYGSYALFSQDWISWCILIYVWTVMFGRNIVNKDKRCGLKPGGKEYIARSGILFPRLRTYFFGTGEGSRKAKDC